MSVKVDVDKSTKARTDGNASFKKGRWTEAIGHYTTAIVFNSEDGLGYSNRAAAYLKIDKWMDAERDCSTAIALAKDGVNVKALYRRALARKSLEDFNGAIKDIQAILRVEPTNETAKEEQEELLELLRIAGVQDEERRKRAKAKALPPSPPRSQASASLVEIPHSPDLQAVPLIKEVLDVPTPANAAPRGSFAEMKNRRQAGRKTYAAPAATPTPPPQALPMPSNDTKPTSPSSLPLEAVSISDNTSLPIPSQPPLPLLDPSVPGSAMSLVTSIRSHPALMTYPLIADLSRRPPSIGRMLDNFLEPDQLALILARLRDTLDLEHEGMQERQEVVRGFMSGLRMTRRWGMTAIMLSAKEKQLGQEVWTVAGGVGDWTKGA